MEFSQVRRQGSGSNLQSIFFLPYLCMELSTFAPFGENFGVFFINFWRELDIDGLHEKSSHLRIKHVLNLLMKLPTILLGCFNICAIVDDHDDHNASIILIYSKGARARV